MKTEAEIRAKRESLWTLADLMGKVFDKTGDEQSGDTAAYSAIMVAALDWVMDELP